MPARHPVRGGPGAFTLTELLVVVAILAVLADLLLPVLSRVKSAGNVETCRNNLRQINLALRLYGDDNQDKSPAVGFITFANYKEVVRSYLSLKGPSSPADAIFTCPADNFFYTDFADTPAYQPNGAHNDATTDFSSYVFNGFNLLTNASHHGAALALPGIGGLALSSVRQPAKTVLTAEAAATFPFSWHQPQHPSASPADHYNDSRNTLGFVDGHVQYLKMYWNNALRYPNGAWSSAIFYNPPPGYDYKWSGN